MTLLRGAIPITKLVCMPVGSVCIYETDIGVAQSKNATAVASKFGAKVCTNIVNGFDGTGKHRAFVVVEVKERGAPYVKELKRGKAYGYWAVNTEGDVEGRTIRNFGIYLGYVDEIAFHLADKCYYSLNFRQVKECDAYTPEYTTKKGSVHISVRGAASILLESKPVAMKKGKYYNSTLITRKLHNA